jgi:transcriptional regulator with XRE-family HTH domain
MNGTGIHVDDLIPKLNPCRQKDLAAILDLTPPRLRIAIALTFAEWTQDEWAEEAGINSVTVGRWRNGFNRIPLGAAFRLARVLGADPLQLFQEQLEHDASSPKLETRSGLSTVDGVRVLSQPHDAG